MPKNLLRDILPNSRSPENGRGSLPVPPKKRGAREISEEIGNEESGSENKSYGNYGNSEPLRYGRFDEPAAENFSENGGTGGKRWTVWLVVGVCVAVLAFSALWIMTSAAIIIKSKSVQSPINLSILARTASSTNALGFKIMTVEKTASESLAPDGAKQTDIKASGKIMVFNNYSSAPQRLIKNTRFESPAGLIYRISQSITVPGKGKLPGSVEATVYADSAGAEYNVDSASFTIPGFKGDPRYKAFYARAISPIAGGFSGMAKYVSPDKLSAEQAKLKNSLAKDLMADVANRIPASFETFANANVINYSEPVSGTNSPDSVTVSEKAVMTVFLFDKNELANYVAGKVVMGYGGEPVEIAGAGNLSFTPTGKPLAPASPEIRFTLKGNATINWLTDTVKLAKDLAGKSKGEMSNVLKSYPSVESAESVVRPFWKSSFPSDPNKINIQIKSN